MIQAVGRVMVYVHDVASTKEFWIHKIGFKEIASQEVDGKIIMFEAAASNENDTTIVFYDYDLVASQNSGIDMAMPSILFSATKLDALYEEFKKKGITVGDLVEIAGMRTFNFADNNGLYYAIREV